jgi:hypothetical protein
LILPALLHRKKLYKFESSICCDFSVQN